MISERMYREFFWAMGGVFGSPSSAVVIWECIIEARAQFCGSLFVFNPCLKRYLWFQPVFLYSLWLIGRTSTILGRALSNELQSMGTIEISTSNEAFALSMSRTALSSERSFSQFRSASPVEAQDPASSTISLSSY